MADLRVKIGNLELKNPVMTASGTFGYGPEYADFVELSEIGGLYLNGWSTYTVNLHDTNVESNTAYLGGGVLVYNCGLNYKNGFVRYNKAIKRDGSTKPTTMYYTNHSKIVNNADAVNTDLSGIGGGIYSTNGYLVTT